MQQMAGLLSPAALETARNRALVAVGCEVGAVCDASAQSLQAG